MARIPTAVIDRIRDEVNIVDVISKYVQLRKEGQNWFGLCPFQTENTPSFSVREDKQFYYCFSCGRSGNVFRFVQEIEHCSFVEAVIKVADFANIPLDEQVRNAASSGQRTSLSGPDQRLRKMYAVADDLYHHVLVNTALGESALQYVHERHLDDEIIEEFHLGFAPTAKQDLLVEVLHEQGFKDDEMRKSGLFVTARDGKLRDRFLGRVMFPLRNENGHVIAFSGRILEKAPNTPKYLNSPETPLFNKRRVLFNLDKARDAIRQGGGVILFEGFMDVIAAYRAGVKNGVASMGTSLTNEQVAVLQRLTTTINVCYDGDEAGQRAINRALGLMLPVKGLQLGVITLPAGLDPDEYLQKYGAEKFQQTLTTTRESPLAFFMRYYRQGRNLANETDQLAYLQDVLRAIAQVDNQMEVDLYLGRLAKEFHLSQEQLALQLAGIRQQAGAQRQEERQEAPREFAQQYAAAPTQREKLSRTERAERLLLHRMFTDNEVRERIFADDTFTFPHEVYEEIYVHFQGYFQDRKEFNVADFLTLVADQRLARVINAIEMAHYPEPAPDGEVDDCLAVIKHDYPIKEKVDKIKQEIADAKRANDQDRIVMLLTSLVKLRQQEQDE